MEDFHVTQNEPSIGNNMVVSMDLEYSIERIPIERDSNQYQ